MDLRMVTFGVRVMGLFILWPVAGHLELPCASHLSMYRRSYLITNNASFGVLGLSFVCMLKTRLTSHTIVLDALWRAVCCSKCHQKYQLM